jgi:hypothetical protein
LTIVLQPMTKMSTTVRLSVSNNCRESSVSIVTRLVPGGHEIRSSISAGRQCPYCPWVRRLSSQWIPVSFPAVERSRRDAGHSSVSAAECNTERTYTSAFFQCIFWERCLIIQSDTPNLSLNFTCANFRPSGPCKWDLSSLGTRIRITGYGCPKYRHNWVA